MSADEANPDLIAEDYHAAIRVLDAEAQTLEWSWTRTHYRLHLLRRMNELALGANPAKRPGQEAPRKDHR